MSKASNFLHERLHLVLLLFDGGFEASLFRRDDHRLEIERARVETVADTVGSRNVDRSG